jgi:predicted DNA-binding transcriptional regulator AlpA
MKDETTTTTGKPEPLLNLRGLSEALGLSRITLWRIKAAGFIPAAIDLGRNATRYRLSDVVQALNERRGEILAVMDANNAQKKNRKAKANRVRQSNQESR